MEENNATAVLKSAWRYAKNRNRRCTDMTRHYQLAAPKIVSQDLYVLEVTKGIVCDQNSLEVLVKCFEDQHKYVAKKMTAAIV